MRTKFLQSVGADEATPVKSDTQLDIEDHDPKPEDSLLLKTIATNKRPSEHLCTPERSESKKRRKTVKDNTVLFDDLVQDLYPSPSAPTVLSFPNSESSEDDEHEEEMPCLPLLLDFNMTDNIDDENFVTKICGPDDTTDDSSATSLAMDVHATWSKEEYNDVGECDEDMTSINTTVSVDESNDMGMSSEMDMVMPALSTQADCQKEDLLLDSLTPVTDDEDESDSGDEHASDIKPISDGTAFGQCMFYALEAPDSFSSYDDDNNTDRLGISDTSKDEMDDNTFFDMLGNVIEELDTDTNVISACAAQDGTSLSESDTPACTAHLESPRSSMWQDTPRKKHVTFDLNAKNIPKSSASIETKKEQKKPCITIRLTSKKTNSKKEQKKPSVSSKLTSKHKMVKKQMKKPVRVASIKPNGKQTEAKKETKVPSVSAKPSNLETKTKEESTKSSVPKNSTGLKLTDIDVLLGRGKRSNNHPGNAKFRSLVEEMKPIYFQKGNKKNKKHAISNQLVDRVHGWGGRFLKETSRNSNVYEEVDVKVARKKCSQRLREGEPKKARGY